ncbi:hypothetical protein [Lactococcus cremoris]|nr:hypothetical protein [Lactococcus cremoris]MDU8932624.1 hypothetical protein [Lactococcus cremoris]
MKNLNLIRKRKIQAKTFFNSKAAKVNFTDKKENGKKFTDGRKKAHKRP